MLSKAELTALFRKNAEQVRINAGVSQEKFADSIDMSVSMYKRLVTGQRNVDAAYALYKLCVLYNVRLFDLFELDYDIYRIASKIERLDKEQAEFIEMIVDRELSRES